MADAVKWTVKPDVLEKESDYTTWRYVMEMNYTTNAKSKNLFKIGTRDRVTDHLNVQLSQHDTEEFLRLEAAMKGLLVKSLAQKFAVQVVGLDRFVDQWERVENICVGEKTTRLVLITQKLRNMKWKGSLTQLLTFFNGLVEEYKMLSGNLSETELTNILLDVLPDKYANFKLLLRKESLVNNGTFELKNVLKLLRLTELDLSGKREDESKKRNNQQKKSDRNG